VEGTVLNLYGNETRVTVNGIPAFVQGNNFLVNHVPLQNGPNTLAVNATDEQGNTTNTSITIHAQTDGSFITLRPDDAYGVSPLETTLSISAPFTTMSPNLFVSGPGPVEFLDGSTTYQYNLRMTVPGVYSFTAEVVDGDVTYSDTISIVVYDQTEVDYLIRSKSDGMKSRLLSSDIEGALEYFALPSQEEYRNIFTRLSSELPSIAIGMEDIEQVCVRGYLAKYRIKQDEVINGVNYRITHYIYFVQDAYGHWYIDGF
jgi:hypothetical protein